MLEVLPPRIMRKVPSPITGAVVGAFVGCFDLALGVLAYIKLAASLQCFAIGIERVVCLLEDSTGKSATEISRATLQAAHNFKKIPWYSIHNLIAGDPGQVEDMTALVLMRPMAP